MGTCDRVFLTGVRFPCVLGFYEWERVHEQTLALDVRLTVDLQPAAGGDLAQSVSYAPVLDDLQFIAQQGRWKLLESMAAAMACHLLAAPCAGEARAQVERVVLSLAKPDVFAGRGVPGIEIDRTREACVLTGVRDGPVEWRTLQVTAETGAYRVSVPPHTHWASPPGTSLRVIAGRIDAGETALQPGDTLGRDTHRVHNATDRPCELLVVVRPPRMP